MAAYRDEVRRELEIARERARRRECPPPPEEYLGKPWYDGARTCDIWRENGILCIMCFAELADRKGIPWDRGIDFYPVSRWTVEHEDSNLSPH